MKQKCITNTGAVFLHMQLFTEFYCINRRWSHPVEREDATYPPETKYFYIYLYQSLYGSKNI
jgi:hypothetical protein